jgi:hypothetical protein
MFVNEEGHLFTHCVQQKLEQHRQVALSDYSLYVFFNSSNTAAHSRIRRGFVDLENFQNANNKRMGQRCCLQPKPTTTIQHN